MNYFDHFYNVHKNHIPSSNFQQALEVQEIKKEKKGEGASKPNEEKKRRKKSRNDNENECSMNYFMWT